MSVRSLPVVTLLLLLSCGAGIAQQIPQFSQYIFNNFRINPGIAGSQECLDGRLAYRNQWVDFEGAPETFHGNLHWRIERDAQGPEVGHHGIGFKVTSDRTGPLSRTMAYGAYAYHVSLSRELKASFGVFAGIQQVRLNVNEVSLSDFNDPLINESRNVLLYPDISPGIWIYTDDLFAGLTVKQAVQNSFKALGDEAKLTPHYYLTAGKKIQSEAYDDFAFLPSTMIRFSPMTPPSIDLNLLVEYQGEVAAGLSYRNTDAVAAMLRFNLLKYFFVGYSFDLTTSKVRLNSANTHEITLGFNICEGAGGAINEVCPAYY